jgi:hypothetical protein
MRNGTAFRLGLGFYDEQIFGRDTLTRSFKFEISGASQPESSRGVPGELREDDVVLIVRLTGAGKHWRSGTTMKPSCGGGENDGVLVGRALGWGKWKTAGAMSFRRVRWC